MHEMMYSTNTYWALIMCYASGGCRHSILCDDSQRTPANDGNKCINKCSNYSPVW